MGADWERFASMCQRARTLRGAQAYRRESGEWKVVLRHADELPRNDELQR